MNKQKRQTHTVDFLFVITLFFLFAFSSLAMIGIGARIYRASVEQQSQNSERRTAYLYITEKIRQNDLADGVSIGSYGEGDALDLARTVNDEIYNTYLYINDGYLMEVMIREGNEASVAPATGQKILPLSTMAIISEGDGLFHFTVDANGDLEEFYVSCACE